MTFSALKHISYSAAGGFAAGSAIGYGLYKNYSTQALGAAHPYIRYTGVVFGVTALVARACDEIFKSFGWRSEPTMRLLASHIVVALIATPAIMLVVGQPAVAGRVVSAALAIGSFAINCIIKG